MKRDIPIGFFKQELKEGDRVVVMLRSGTYYLREAKIHSITYERAFRSVYNQVTRRYDTKEEYEQPVVKIIYEKEEKKWVYDPVTMKGHFESLGTKSRISRIWNWRSAITL